MVEEADAPSEKRAGLIYAIALVDEAIDVVEKRIDLLDDKPLTARDIDELTRTSALMVLERFRDALRGVQTVTRAIKLADESIAAIRNAPPAGR
jgi:hypothetical protein